MKVVDRKTGQKLDAITQSVDINFNGVYVLRYIIGIQGHNQFHFIHAIYDNDTFNEMYKVVEE